MRAESESKDGGQNWFPSIKAIEQPLCSAAGDRFLQPLRTAWEPPRMISKFGDFRDDLSAL
jgi:hypothetical protein